MCAYVSLILKCRILYVSFLINNWNSSIMLIYFINKKFLLSSYHEKGLTVWIYVYQNKTSTLISHLLGHGWLSPTLIATTTEPPLEPTTASAYVTTIMRSKQTSPPIFHLPHHHLHRSLDHQSLNSKVRSILLKICSSWCPFQSPLSQFLLRTPLPSRPSCKTLSLLLTQFTCMCMCSTREIILSSLL